jgi:long-chain fatty acid transport protein
MRRLLFVLLMVALLAPMVAQGTQGDNFIGYGAVSRAMGGTGIAQPMGAESVLKNPALLTYSKGFSFTFAGTYFKPEVSSKASIATEKTSTADKAMIPAIGLVSELGNNLFFGLGAYGTGGSGVDYRDTATGDKLYRLSTVLSMMKFVPTLAYKMDNLSIGLGAAIMYGALGLTYDRGMNAAAAQGGGAIGSEGPGTSDDLGYGFDLGLAYQFNNFTFGFNYQSAIEMEYKKQLVDAAADFGVSAIITSDKLEQPAEIGLGVSYVWNALTATIDYKQVKWSDATGYKQFKWEDQDLFSLGLAYNLGKTDLRFGYSMGDAPVQDKAIKTTAATTDYPINLLNGVGFPATSDSHITFGVGHDVTKTFSMDFAFVYSPEVEITANYLTAADGAYTYTTKHSEKSLTLAANWQF